MMMKILPFKIAQPVDTSCWVQQDEMPHLYDILHRHIEFQITLIEASTGNAIVGESICDFMPGDIFVFGPDLPHAFRNDFHYYREDSDLLAKALSVYFEWDVFGTKFWNMPEQRLLLDFYNQANQGVYYAASKNKELKTALLELADSHGLDRIIKLLTLLKNLAMAQHGIVLTVSGKYSVLNEKDEKRLDAVYRFTLNEYHRPIALSEVAGIAHMTVHSFCRYFKIRTRKSYLEFLTLYRLGQACKFLQNGDLSIAEIGYKVGFGNLSNFNRKFLNYYGFTPRDYRKKQSGQG